jgi:murein DD-endopeptidase MepM/ murein hydrolase activator NlpD
VFLAGLVALGCLIGAGPRAGADEKALASAQAKANRAASELARAEDVLGELEGDISDLEAEAADAQARLDLLAVAAREVLIRRFINADNAQVQELDPDINNQARADALSRYAMQGNQDALDSYESAAEDLAIAKEQLSARRSSQKAAVDHLEARKAALDREFDRLEKLEKERIAAAARKKAASTKLAASSPKGGRVIGGIVCPVAGAVAFSDSWGSARSGGRAHKGVDMLARSGTPTVAPVSGVVSHRGNGVGGLSWHLNGDDGHYYYGTHLSSYENVGAGHVSQGTVIGYVGDTGNARGTPHLHFEIHPNRGAAVNPYPTVRAAC